MRRIIRRGYYHLKKISFDDTDWSNEQLLLNKITDVCSELKEFYPQLSGSFDQDINTIIDEMTQFESALAR